MHKFLHILEHSFFDSIKILPILLIVYLLIELLEYKQAIKFEKLKFLNNNKAPLFGAMFGILPQCGFSVIATDLFAKRKLGVGALIAVYIATSDEAIPIMISNPAGWKGVLPLLVIKFVIAIIAGYVFQFFFDKIFIKDKFFIIDSEEEEHHHDEEEEESHGCCNHNVSKYDWKHPLLHCLKIVITIFVINLIFGAIIEFGFKGEENLSKFLSKNGIFAIQPIIAMLIGFIPNCASSVVLTELYLIKGISFGSLLSGLIANAGLGLILLLKENKKIKENLFIITSLIITSLIFGYLLHILI